MAKQMQPYLTPKQEKFVRNYAAVHNMTLSDAMSYIVMEFQKIERQKEIEKLKDEFCAY